MPRFSNPIRSARICRASIALFLLATIAVSSRASHAAPVCDARAFGAKGDGTTKDTHALQNAIDACAGKGGGTVLLTNGTFLTGPLVLKSHITLDVQTGATLLGSQDKTDYPPARELNEPAVQPLISASHADHITLRGGGIIDGAGQPWWADVTSHRHMPDFSPALRPRLILFDHCRHIRIEGITVQNSPSWQIVLYNTSDVLIRNGKVLAPARSPNTDGIDPFSSHHVRIEHMTIDTGDDNVAIKSGQPGSPGPDEPSTDIAIRDCTFLHGHGLSIGSEIAGGVQNVRASHITFTGTANGVRIKSGRDRGGDIGRFTFRDLTMENVGTPILITAYYGQRRGASAAAQPVTRLTPRFHDIRIAHLTATGAREAGIIEGLPESPIATLTLSDIRIAAQRGMTVRDATVHAHGLAISAADGKPIVPLSAATVIGH
ncbi:MAG: glycoside hydrolase family 28 protein [Terracidiphilus sp.]